MCKQFIYILLIILFIIFNLNYVHLKRNYIIGKRTGDTIYKGSILSFSNRINKLTKYLPSTVRQLTSLSSLSSSLSSSSPTSSSSSSSSPTTYTSNYLQNGANNSTMETVFGELLFTYINEQLKDYIKNGSLDLSIPSMDPLCFNKITFDPLLAGDPFNIRFENIRINGLSNIQLKDLTPKLSELKFTLTIIFPIITIDGYYIVNGTMYDVFELNGSGNGYAEYTDVLFRTTVKMQQNNRTLTILSADAPYLDYKEARINLKRNDGRVTKTKSNTLAGELGPTIFWMIADHVVETIDIYLNKLLTDALKNFQLPINFKPITTWLTINTRRNSNTGNGNLLRKFLPTNFNQLLNTFLQLRNQINLPLVIDTMRSTFRAKNDKKSLKKV